MKLSYKNINLHLSINYIRFCLISVIVLLTTNLTAQVKVSAKDSALYQAAMEDAVYLKKQNIDNNLFPIDKSNKDLVWKTVNGEEYVLVVTWKGQGSIGFYEPFVQWGYFNTGNWPVWVTAAPQLLDFMKKENPKDPNMRLLQLLGLPPNSVYTHFVELWVKPSDLLRPCLDNEISDKSCGVCMPANIDSTYKAWVNATRLGRYFPDKCGLFNQYPWTCLGYTYDWNPNNKKHFGMSEYVIPANTNAVVNAIYTTEEYLNK